MASSDHIHRATQYISEQSPYKYRLPRYQQVSRELYSPNPDCRPLLHCDTLLDIGAGWTDFDYHLRRDWDWHGRYFPIDAGLDGTDLATWKAQQKVAWAVIIETLEHLENLAIITELIHDLQAHVASGIVATVPDPNKVDVLGQCPDHKTVITAAQLQALGFKVREWDNTLIATWRAH